MSCHLAQHGTALRVTWNHESRYCVTRTQSTEKTCGNVVGFGVPPPVPPMAALMTTYIGTSGTLPAPVTVRSVRKPAPSSASTEKIDRVFAPIQPIHHVARGRVEGQRRQVQATGAR